MLQVVGFLVAFDLFELRLFRRDQQLEHEHALGLGVQRVGQPFQAFGLPLIQRLFALRIVADQHLAEAEVERLNVLEEVFAVLEVELFLAALLGGAGGRVAVLGGVGEDGGAELLVHEDAGLGLRYAVRDGLFEGVVDDFLGGGDLGGLSGRQGAFPAEHFFLERAAMVERQNVQRLIESHAHDAVSFSER